MQLQNKIYKFSNWSVNVKRFRFLSDIIVRSFPHCIWIYLLQWNHVNLLWTINNFSEQYLETLWIGTEGYFNSTWIQFPRKWSNYYIGKETKFADPYIVIYKAWNILKSVSWLINIKSRSNIKTCKQLFLFLITYDDDVINIVIFVNNKYFA
jgi:hypothetical protein